MGLFNNRISLQIEVYDRKTVDLIFGVINYQFNWDLPIVVPNVG